MSKMEVRKYDVGNSSVTACINEKLKVFLNNFFIMVIAHLGILIYLVLPYFFVSLNRFNFAMPLPQGFLKSFV